MYIDRRIGPKLTNIYNNLNTYERNLKGEVTQIEI